MSTGSIIVFMIVIGITVFNYFLGGVWWVVITDKAEVLE